MTMTMTMPDDAVGFRKRSTALFGAFVVGLVLVAVAIAALGWWLGGWWGLAGGATIGAVVLVGGLVAGTLLWAMTQDSA